MERQHLGSSNERISIHTLEEEFNRSISHGRHLSEQLDEDLSASITSLIQPSIEPEENLSPQEVRQLLEKEHEKTLIAVGILNTSEKRLRELRRVVYGSASSPPPIASGSRREYDDVILGNIDDENVSEDSIPSFPIYEDDIGATNDWLRARNHLLEFKQARLIRENTYLRFISKY